jgi:hypothetical protein
LIIGEKYETYEEGLMRGIISEICLSLSLSLEVKVNNYSQGSFEFIVLDEFLQSG